jgi:hypothetical protein
MHSGYGTNLKYGKDVFYDFLLKDWLLSSVVSTKISGITVALLGGIILCPFAKGTPLTEKG